MAKQEKSLRAKLMYQKEIKKQKHKSLLMQWWIKLEKSNRVRKKNEDKDERRALATQEQEGSIPARVENFFPCARWT